MQGTTTQKTFHVLKAYRVKIHLPFWRKNLCLWRACGYPNMWPTIHRTLSSLTGYDVGHCSTVHKSCVVLTFREARTSFVKWLGKKFWSACYTWNCYRSRLPARRFLVFHPILQVSDFPYLVHGTQPATGLLRSGYDSDDRVKCHGRDHKL